MKCSFETINLFKYDIKEVIKLIQKVKGTQDILSEESAKWQKIENEIRNICHIYGFKEIRVPIIEYTEVFTSSIGE